MKNMQSLIFDRYSVGYQIHHSHIICRNRTVFLSAEEKESRIL